MDFPFSYEQVIQLSDCNICPHNCRVSRFSDKLGYCGISASIAVSSVCIHHGEEPPVSGPDGICNIFFSGCNLQCLFCQNYQISSKKCSTIKPGVSLNTILDQIIIILNKGITHLGFVSPSHVIPQMKLIIKGLHARGYFPVTVYNTNAYDKVETIRSLEGIIDVYLPDFKYMEAEPAKELSGAADYPLIASAAIKEMYRQKGAQLNLDDKGKAESGIIIRHLVLPGMIENSMKVLHHISEEISTDIHISLMSQYHPTPAVKTIPNLNRTLLASEYEIITGELEKLGFENGWIQELESPQNYQPDFEKENPFDF